MRATSSPPHKSRCLLVNCSKAKRQDVRPLPALERYDGMHFRILRRFLKNYPNAAQDLEIFILSAEFGLITATRLLPLYDRRMTPQRASVLRPQVCVELQSHLQRGNYAELFVSLTTNYRAALPTLEEVVPSGILILQARGAQGIKAAQFKRWLYGPQTDHLKPPIKRGHHSPRHGGTIHGCFLSLTPARILDQARTALHKGEGDPSNFRGWYALVDGQRVGTKWLVSLISGLPVSAFTAGEARRVLARLNIEIYRV